MMKRTCALLLSLLLCLLAVGATLAAETEEDLKAWYAVGAEENTFDGLYRRMCTNLDLHAHPAPEADSRKNRSTYSFGEFEICTVLTNSEEAYEVMGKVYSRDGSEKYLFHRWIGFGEDGAIIGMDVYYSLHGRYIGNIRHNYTEGTSLPSHRCPYTIPGEELMK